jgi:hypothetical protein
MQMRIQKFLKGDFQKVKLFIFVKFSWINERLVTRDGNKYRPVTDFVRVVSVGACPKPMTVDTPVRFILF